jgi:hypothetical protein
MGDVPKTEIPKHVVSENPSMHGNQHHVCVLADNRQSRGLKVADVTFRFDQHSDTFTPSFLERLDDC